MCPEIFRVFFAFQVSFDFSGKNYCHLPLRGVLWIRRETESWRVCTTWNPASLSWLVRQNWGLETTVICRRVLRLDPGKSRKTAWVSEGSLRPFLAHTSWIWGRGVSRAEVKCSFGTCSQCLVSKINPKSLESCISSQMAQSLALGLAAVLKGPSF